MTAKPASTGAHHSVAERLELALLGDPSVAGCAVRARSGKDGASRLVVYVVPSGPANRAALEDRVRGILPEGSTPILLAPISTLPLGPEGELDETALSSTPAISPELPQRWEEELVAAAGIDQAATILRERLVRLPQLHLDDLLPNRLNRERQDAPACAPQATAPSETTREEPGERLSLSDGGVLTEPVPNLLSETLVRAATEHGDAGVHHLQPDGSDVFQPYPELLDEAARILSGLRALGLRPGAHVIFQLPASGDFLPAFWACVLGGLIPVPVSIAPRYEPSNAAVQKLLHAWRMLDRPVVLASSSLESALRSLADHVADEGDLRVHTLDSWRRREAVSDWCHPEPDSPALMMLTSGSTGAAKGVVLTHHNLLCRSAGSTQMNGFTSSEVTFNWMALDHVAGIIYFHLRDVFLGCHQIHCASDVILQDPLKWLDLIERFGVTITFAPNFAFGLLNEAVQAAGDRHWDLSSLRFLLNGGEAIVASTARRFLTLFGPRGLRGNCLVPAWGMSETSSGVTYSDRFSLETTSDDDQFVEVGRPIPGFSVRIVDADNRVVPEGTIGQLHVKGSTVTGGYYAAPRVNAESFTDDGWFVTGDLGLLRDGRLSITGREKDEIIINGVNYVGAEIESVVEDIEGVRSSYAAACAVRPANRDTEGLAIFFAPTSDDDDSLRVTLNAIRRRVATAVGISPSHLIPLDAEEIPKTAIGKIQRRQLKQRFEGGDFESIARRVDLLLEGTNTLPNWFYRRSWRRRELPSRPVGGVGNALVFLDGLGVGEELCKSLHAAGRACVCVEGGSSFVRTAADRFRLDTGNPAHYAKLFETLQAEDIQLEHLAYLSSYSLLEPVADAEELGRSQVRLLSDLLGLVRALDEAWSETQPARLLVITSHGQAVLDDDEVACEKLALSGFVKSIARELPALDCRHLDLPVDTPERHAARVLQELATDERDEEVAYRDDQRLVCRLERVDFAADLQHEQPFERGGRYLLSGGLGGIARELARHLLDSYDARLLLIGRTSLPERSEWGREDLPEALRDRIRALRSLERSGGEFTYEAVDVCDASAVRAVVERAESRWSAPLDGVIHLAGSFHERPLLEESGDSLRRALAAKTEGALVLHRLLEERGGGFFACFGSLIGFFGGAGVAAYAAGSSFLSGFCRWQDRRTPVHSHCFEWSIWSDVGIGRGYATRDLSRARGYRTLSVDQALNSFLVGLHHGERQLLIGFDGGNPNVRRYTTNFTPVEELCGYITLAAGAEEPVPAPRPRDEFGTAIPHELVRLDEMPLTDRGGIDREALAALTRGAGGGLEAVAPRDELERVIADIWQQVLGLPQVGVHDDFLALGGDSVRAAIVINRLQERLGEILHVVAIFEAPTVAELAEYLKENYPKSASQVLGREMDSQPAAVERRVDAVGVAALRRLMGAPAPPPAVSPHKNRRAVFVLAPPRSGSTLMRVMLGGHPRLFAPPELYLLSFGTLRERRAAYTGVHSFWLEGLVRAVMELHDCTPEEAERLLTELEERDLSTASFYGLMQEWLGERTLVDKTPTYCFHPGALERAEQEFDAPLYIHLLRHPYGVIRSFEEARVEQLLHPHIPALREPGAPTFRRRELAELIWTVCHENILEALRGVPAERQHQVRFEDLVSRPRPTIEGICGFLGLDLRPEMLRPYENPEGRMTDGVHSVSRMIGDFKFHQHGEIVAEVAESWRKHYDDDFLGEPTWRVTRALGYARIRDEDKGGESDAIPRAPRSSDEPLATEVDELTEGEVDALLADLLAKRGLGDRE